MKKTISTLALCSVAALAAAAPRTPEQALAIARQFVLHTPALSHIPGTGLSLSSSVTARQKVRTANGETAPAYYVVNLGEDDGMVIVSGDDRFKPVLGYTTSCSTDDAEDMPEGLAYWLGFLEAEMTAAVANGYTGAEASVSEADFSQSVEPLLTTQWDQAAPYNKKIPNFATGCVATGVAQVMNYWKYPLHGVGSHTNANYSQYSADFGATTYDWANMKDTYGGKYDTQAEVEAVSTLMYHLGVATDMMWKSPSEGSGTANMLGANALINYFGYNKYIYSEQRDCISYGAWRALVLQQLQTGHPICYAGLTENRGVGHFFVLDGYAAETGLFHFNWGWSGKYDGYYSLTSLEPGTGGIGGGQGKFNYDQHIFVNVQPTETGEYVAHFDAEKIYPKSFKGKASSFAISTDYIAHNALNFSGTIGLAIYNADGTFNRYIESDTPMSAMVRLGSYYNGTLDFAFHLTDVADGDYVVCLASRHSSYPEKVFPVRAWYDHCTYYNMSVSGEDITFAEKQTDNTLESTSAPVITDAREEKTLFQNVVSSFKIKIKNTGASLFFDEVGVSIKKGRESSPQCIMVPCSLAPGEEKTVEVSGKVLREPGTYTLAACYGVNGSYTHLSDGAYSVTVKDEASAIENLTVGNVAGDDAIYTISGMRVASSAALPKGVYVRSGKKFVITK